MKSTPLSLQLKIATYTATIRLDDTALILQGAIPAAGLALPVQGRFELIERGLLPRGLRLRANPGKSVG